MNQSVTAPIANPVELSPLPLKTCHDILVRDIDRGRSDLVLTRGLWALLTVAGVRDMSPEQAEASLRERAAAALEGGFTLPDQRVKS